MSKRGSHNVAIYRVIKNSLHTLSMSAFGFTHVCTKTPSCSEYLVEQIELHGTMRGLWRGLKRILTCW